jgi:polar amino acid transport system substrate-binding protein
MAKLLPPALQRRRVLGLSGAVALAMGRGPAHAQTGRLAGALRRGALRIGVWLGTRPFSFRNAEGELDGMEIAVARLVAQGLGLRADFVPLRIDERVPALDAGAIDVCYGAFVVVPERARQAMFLQPHALTEFGILTRRDRPLRGPRELAGLRLGLADDPLVLRVAGSAIRPDQEVVQYPDNEATHAALLSRQVDALFTTRARSMIAEQEHPELVWRFAVQQHWMAGLVAFGEHDLLRAANTGLGIARDQGVLEALSLQHLGYSGGRPPVI